jgi:IPT/TIG domain
MYVSLECTAGSPDVTITIDGANFGHYGHFVCSTAFWTTDANLHDHGTMLQTTIVSSSQLTAVIPASLLQSPTSVQILVMNGDVMGMSDGYFGYPRSNSVTFTGALDQRLSSHARLGVRYGLLPAARGVRSDAPSRRQGMNPTMTDAVSCITTGDGGTECEGFSVLHWRQSPYSRWNCSLKQTRRPHSQPHSS